MRSLLTGSDICGQNSNVCIQQRRMKGLFIITMTAARLSYVVAILYSVSGHDIFFFVNILTLLRSTLHYRLLTASDQLPDSDCLAPSHISE